jgi:hypothetical protein
MSLEEMKTEVEEAEFPVWKGEVDYELRIDGKDLASVLQAFAAEYEERQREKGRSAYIAEVILDSVYLHLGYELIAVTERELSRNVGGGERGSVPERLVSKLAAATVDESSPSGKRIVRLFSAVPFSVLDAIEEEFKTEVVNHHDYRYWGYGSEQETEAHYAEMSRPCAQTHVAPPPCEESVLAAIRKKIGTKKASSS